VSNFVNIYFTDLSITSYNANVSTFVTVSDESRWGHVDGELPFPSPYRGITLYTVKVRRLCWRIDKSTTRIFCMHSLMLFVDTNDYKMEILLHLYYFDK